MSRSVRGAQDKELRDLVFARVISARTTADWVDDAASCAAWLLASFWRSTRWTICDILGMSAGECAGHALTR